MNCTELVPPLHVRARALRRLLVLMMKNTTLVPVLGLCCHYHVGKYIWRISLQKKIWEELRCHAASHWIFHAIKGISKLVCLQVSKSRHLLVSFCSIEQTNAAHEVLA